jgi:hypothetical protein
MIRVIKSKRMRERSCSRNWGKERCKQVSVGEGKTPFGSPTRRWEYNIKMYRAQNGCGLDRSGPGQAKMTGPCCEYGNKTSGRKKCR